jgi:hypothetical protein
MPPVETTSDDSAAGNQRLTMQALQAQNSYGSNLTDTEEELALANTDAVFEFACRYVVMRSLPGWIEEIYAEHLLSTQPVRPH